MQGRPELKYRAVAADIARRIREGELAPGTRLPAERELADEYEVGYSTIRRAMDILREEELIETRWGEGNVVREQES